MIKLFEEIDLKLGKSTDLFPLKCENCGKTFYAEKKAIQYEEVHNRGRLKFCSVQCSDASHKESVHHAFCQCCGKPIEVKNSEYRRSKTKQFYCNRSCAAKINNSRRERSVETNLKASETMKRRWAEGDIQKYITLQCKERTCRVCGKTYTNHKFTNPGATRAFCSTECQKYYWLHRKQFYNEAIDRTEGARQRLHDGAMKSLKTQGDSRRSKNEMYFCSLCENYFSNIEHNHAIFNGWDADVIVHDYKIAVLWNGPWHYKEIYKGSLLKTQNRDKIKIQEIEKYGYKPYIIRDDGPHNPQFVEAEFQKFLNYIRNNIDNKV